MAVRKSGGLLGALTLYHVAATAIFMGILAVSVLPRFDTDLWWHLWVGRHILGSGVPGRDFLSFTVQGHSWIDHEWLSEVLMFGAFKLGGLKLLLTVFGLITTGAFALVFLVMRLRGVSQVLALALTVVIAVATVAVWGPRVQMMSVLFVAAFCFMLERHRATAGVEWLAGLVASMWLWSNLHGGFVIGWLLIGTYLVGGLFDRVQGGMSWAQALRRQRPLAAALAASVVVTVVNPNGLRQLIYPLKFLTPNAFTNTIVESQSPNFHLYQTLPFELLLIGLIAGALLVRRRVSWIELLVCVLFTHLALQQTRNVILWCVVLVPVIAVYFQEVGSFLTERWHHLNRSVQSRPLQFANWALLVMVIVLGTGFMARIDTPSSIWAAEKSAFPAQAIAYIRSQRPAGNVFNSYSFGGYLIWKTDAGVPTFIDSRADTVYNDTTLSNYQTIYYARTGWQRLLHKYRIRWILVEPEAPIATVLSQTDGWQTVYHGKLATISEYKG
jgi:hypothetical protein